jgi:hypothetical protein
MVKTPSFRQLGGRILVFSSFSKKKKKRRRRIYVINFKKLKKGVKDVEK